MSSSSSTATSGNPVKTDDELKGLLDQLDSVNNFRTFMKWKGAFLKRFESFVEQSGVAPATAAYQAFGKRMGLLEKKLVQVDKHVSDGELSENKTTVKARNSLNEMNKTLTEAIGEIRALIPSTGADEKKRGYNKYHLAVALLRDNFSEYERIQRCNEMMQRMRQEGLSKVADKQQLDEMENFNTQLERFKDILTDLGLFDVMLKCRMFGSGDADEVVLFDSKTGSIIELPRAFCIEKGILTVTSKDGKESIQEAESDRREKEEMIQVIKNVLQLA